MNNTTQCNAKICKADLMRKVLNKGTLQMKISNVKQMSFNIFKEFYKR